MHMPESYVLFCLRSLWGDPAGHDGELFCTWFPERLPFLLPLCMEDIGHSRGKGRYETTSGNALHSLSWVRHEELVLLFIAVMVSVMFCYEHLLCASYWANLLNVHDFWTFPPASPIQIEAYVLHVHWSSKSSSHLVKQSRHYPPTLIKTPSGCSGRQGTNLEFLDTSECCVSKWYYKES